MIDDPQGPGEQNRIFQNSERYVSQLPRSGIVAHCLYPYSCRNFAMTVRGLIPKRPGGEFICERGDCTLSVPENVRCRKLFFVLRSRTVVGFVRSTEYLDNHG